jgi:RND family efflux transporter MFP subunit
MMNASRLCLIALAALLSACGPAAAPESESAPSVVRVRAAEIVSADGLAWSLSGTVQSRNEAVLGFRLPGQIIERRVYAGERVKAGQLLVKLDPRDVAQQQLAAQAGLASARAQADNTEATRKRLEQLRAQQLVPLQAYEDARAAARAAAEAVRAAEAALAQASSASEYAELKAPASGVVVGTSAEVGQVVAAGQGVLRLAYDGPREVEVDVPELRRAQLPELATVSLFGTPRTAPARLREVAGAADPVTRTWRARYTIEDEPDNWPLGQSLVLHLQDQAGIDALQRVPLGALIDQGAGTAVWRIAAGRVQRQPVELVRVDSEYAYIRSALADGSQVIALGAHLLEEGQLVEILP